MYIAQININRSVKIIQTATHSYCSIKTEEAQLSKFFQEDESRYRICSLRSPWRSSWCWYHCSQESLEWIEIKKINDKTSLFHSLSTKHNILIRLDRITGRLWIACRSKIKTCTVWKRKSSGRAGSVGMWKFCSTCKPFVLKMRKRMASCCSQLALSVVLTLLQLSHQVVVLKESVAAECVCEQNLMSKKKI